MGKMTKAKASKAPVQRKTVIVQAKKPRKRTARSGGSKLFGPVGGLVGSYFGGTSGAAVGMAAGDLLARITGFGDYKVASNSLINGNPVPSFKQEGDGIVLCHSELIADVVGSVEFELHAYNINPALPGSFPFLSLIAQNFEEYEMMGLVYEYRPSSGTAVSSTNSAMGWVIMATDYDALNPNFSTRIAMESYEFSTPTVAYRGALHGVECKRTRNVLENLYTRVGPPPASADLRMYDMGKFQIATVGMQEANTVGELRVTYHVRLRKPRIPSVSQTVSRNFIHFMENPAGSTTPGIAGPFGPSAEARLAPGSVGDYVRPFGSPGQFLLPQSGDYFVYMVAKITEGVLSAGFTWTVGTNIVAGPPLFHDQATDNVQFFSVTAETAIITAALTVTSDGLGGENVLAVTGLTGAEAGNCDAFFFSLPAGASADIFALLRSGNKNAPRRPIFHCDTDEKSVDLSSDLEKFVLADCHLVRTRPAVPAVTTVKK